MKKTYLIPTIKTMRLAESLMVDVSNTEIGDGFEEGAKDMELDYENYGSAFNLKNVWDD